MKAFLTQKSVSVEVWCRVQKFCRLRILLDKLSLKESASRLQGMDAGQLAGKDVHLKRVMRALTLSL